MEYRLFEDNDANSVVKLLNKYRFYYSSHRPVTGLEYLQFQKKRGVYFTVLCLDKGDVVAMLSAYPTLGQKVAKPHQVFIGSMLIEEKYRRGPTMILKLYEIALAEMFKYGFREVIVEVYPDNIQPLYLLKKFGFVRTDDSVNIFGYIVMHNYYGALQRFLKGSEGKEPMDQRDMFLFHPVVDKKKVLETQTIIDGRYIELDYNFYGEKSGLMIDILSVTVAGVYLKDVFKLYPSGSAHIFANYTKKEINIKITSLNLDERRETIYCAPPKQEITIDFPQGENIVEFYGIMFHFENQIGTANSLSEVKAQCTLENIDREINNSRLPEIRIGEYLILFDPLTGFMDVKHGNENFLRFMWPCVKPPYLEGGILPREKDITVIYGGTGEAITEKTSAAAGEASIKTTAETTLITMIENNPSYQVKRSFKIDENSVMLTTRMTLFESGIIPEPLSLIWLETKDGSLTLFKGDLELHHKMVEDHSKQIIFYWNPDDKSPLASAFERIQLDTPAGEAGIELGSYRSTVVSDPYNIGFYLDFDMDRLFEEQVVESMRIVF
jgi:hypothetical protein